jgi:B-cell receptor-associated protein 31
MKILFVFIFVLFLDALNTSLKSGDQKNDAAFNRDTQLAFNTKVFRAQRNMYLTGFTLFLSLVLNRYITVIAQNVKYEEEVQQLKSQLASTKKKD